MSLLQKLDCLFTVSGLVKNLAQGLDFLFIWLIALVNYGIWSQRMVSSLISLEVVRVVIECAIPSVDASAR